MAKKTMSMEMWVSEYQNARNRVERITQSRIARFRKMCSDAGLGGEYCSLLLHNAMVSYHKGEPWQGIDYSKARKAQRFERTIHAAYHVLDRWCDKNRAF